MTGRSIPRREFVLMAAAGVLLAGTPLLGQEAAPMAAEPAKPKRVKPPALPLEAVKEFVGVAHSNFGRVKELLAEYPTLVNASLDQGGGDWETGLGAAAHTGGVDIAEHLLSLGARMDVFAAVMLGKVALFEAFLADDPGIVNLKGPHGLSLEHHARKGGHEELAVRIEGLKGKS